MAVNSLQTAAAVGGQTSQLFIIISFVMKCEKNKSHELLTKQIILNCAEMIMAYMT